MRRVPGVGDHLYGAAPQRRHGDRAEIAPVDQLLFSPVQHGERDFKIMHHRALVAGPAGDETGPEIAARAPVCAQNVVEEERRNVREARFEERCDIGGRLDIVDTFWKGNFIAGLGRNASLIASPDVSGGVPKMTNPRGFLRSGAISSAT